MKAKVIDRERKKNAEWEKKKSFLSVGNNNNMTEQIESYVFIKREENKTMTINSWSTPLNWTFFQANPIS